MMLFTFWFFFSIAISLLASSFNKSAIVWFCISFITSPFICLFLLIFFEKDKINKENFKNKIPRIMKRK